MAPAFRIGRFDVTPDLNRIVDPARPDEPLQVEPKVMDVLVCLHRAGGQVLSRDQLLAEVWSGTVVSPDVLTRAIGQLRRVLGDDPQNPRYIETIARRGYRLLEVAATGSGVGVSSTEAPAVAEPTKKRVSWPRALALLLVLVGLVGLAFYQRGANADRVVRPTRVVPITSFAGPELDPAVSPDGRQIAFAAQAEGADHFDLHIYDLHSGETRRLTFEDDDARHPAWSFDGQTLAYIREGDGCEVFTIPAEGGVPTDVHACGHDGVHDLAWTPDGHHLLMTRWAGTGEPAGLAVLDLDSGEFVALTHPEGDDTLDSMPAFSPDGSWLAFARMRTSGAEDIWVMSFPDGEPRRLTHDGSCQTGLDWSEDGRRIVYSSHRAGVYALWEAPVDGGPAKLVLGGGDKIKDPSTARQANLVAFENWVYEANIWVAPLTGEELPARPLIRSTQWDLQPAYAPDGSRLAFVSNRSGTSQIWLSDADGAHPRRLTDFEEARAGRPVWSPDGTRLAFVVLLQGQADIYAMAVDGGSPFALTHAPGDELAPSWTGNGQGVYFASRSSGDWQVWRVALNGGEQRQITRENGFAARESADGQSLYFTRSDENGLWRMPLAGGAAQRVVDDLSLVDWGNWDLVGGGVCYLDRDAEGGPVIRRWDARSGQSFFVAAADSVVGQGFSVSPDGRWVAYCQADRSECDILAAEGLR